MSRTTVTPLPPQSVPAEEGVKTSPGDPARVYEPPIGDAPLDDIERALVRALARIIVRQIQAAGLVG